MPRVARRVLQTRGYADADVFALLVGHDWFHDLSFDLHDDDQARTAWQALRDRVFDLLERRQRRGCVETTPWGARFDAVGARI